MFKSETTHDHELPKFGLSCFFFYDNYYYTVAVFFISARIRITVLIVTGTLIHLVTLRILIRI